MGWVHWTLPPRKKCSRLSHFFEISRDSWSKWERMDKRRKEMDMSWRSNRLKMRILPKHRIIYLWIRVIWSRIGRNHTKLRDILTARMVNCMRITMCQGKRWSSNQTQWQSVIKRIRISTRGCRDRVLIRQIWTSISKCRWWVGSMGTWKVSIRARINRSTLTRVREYSQVIRNSSQTDRATSFRISSSNWVTTRHARR